MVMSESTSGWPHFEQKAAPSGLAELQCGQVTSSWPDTGAPIVCPSADAGAPFADIDRTRRRGSRNLSRKRKENRCPMKIPGAAPPASPGESPRSGRLRVRAAERRHRPCRPALGLVESSSSAWLCPAASADRRRACPRAADAEAARPPWQGSPADGGVCRTVLQQPPPASPADDERHPVEHHRRAQEGAAQVARVRRPAGSAAPGHPDGPASTTARRSCLEPANQVVRRSACSRRMGHTGKTIHALMSRQCPHQHHCQPQQSSFLHSSAPPPPPSRPQQQAPPHPHANKPKATLQLERGAVSGIKLRSCVVEARAAMSSP